MAMTWKNTTAATRRLQPSTKDWKPSAGQSGGLEFLINTASGALWADPGAGKTSITLTAFAELKHMKMARKMLVLAPLRVCQLVWRQEAAKWSHTCHLKVVLCHGPKKDKMLESEADIYLVNYEGMEWLAKAMKGRPWPFDIICADELTKVKKNTGKRVKALKPYLSKARRRWGLTGTPAPNGYLDLFGQFHFLDDGASLGRYFSHYRDMYFQPGYDGFTWELRKGAEDEIKKRIEKSVYRIEYTDLPEFVDDPRILQMPPANMATYRQMKDAMLIEVDGKTITAANSAATFAKLRQMANGAVYTSPNMDEAVPLNRKREFVTIHDVKLDALEELLEELQGKPLLVAYSFQHDLARIRARLGDDIPTLGSGTTEARAVELQDKWNAGKLPIMLCHPDSVGHGLNLQQGNAAHLCWFSADFNLELYDQFRRRIWRQGNKAERVFNHRLIVQGTIDELVYSALEDKDVTQARLLQSVREVLNTSAGEEDPAAEEGAPIMAIRPRLPTQAQANDTPTEARGPAKGWGRPVNPEEAAGDTPPPRRAPDQGEAIRAKLAPTVEADVAEEEEAPPARRFFSKGLQDKIEGADDGSDGPVEEAVAVTPPKVRATKPKAEKPDVVEPKPSAYEDTPPWETSEPVANSVGSYANQPYINITINVGGTEDQVGAVMKRLFG